MHPGTLVRTGLYLAISGALAMGDATNLAHVQDPTTYVPVENTLTSEQRAQGWQLLFDGKTTNGWRAFGQKEASAGWEAVDGALTRVGPGGDLISVDQFDNFELELEWKIPEGGNSGIMYRVSEDAEETYHTGPELQILDNERHKDGKDPRRTAGACYALYAPVKDVSRPIGSWNTVRLLVDGNHVEHWMNGTKVVEYELFSDDWQKRVQESKFNEWPNFGRVPKGHIALQDHGDRVAFRNIRIRPIAGRTKSQAAE